MWTGGSALWDYGAIAEWWNWVATWLNWTRAVNVLGLGIGLMVARGIIRRIQALV